MRQEIEALQRTFIEAFLSPDSARFHLLLAPVGAGKGYTGAQIVSQLCCDNPGVRVLVLAPRVLAAQWADRLTSRSGGSRAVFVDRGKLVEMQGAAGPGNSPWPEAGVVVLGIEFAVRRDVSELLANCRWDLIVYDEAHNLGASRRAMLRNLLAAENHPRLLLLSSFPIPNLEDWCASAVIVTDWRQVVATVRGQSNPLMFARSAAERRLFEHLRGSLARWRATSREDMRPTVIARAAQSSLPALEHALARCASPSAIVEVPDSDEDSADLPTTSTDQQADLQALLAELNEIDSDSKLDALDAWLTKYRSHQPDRPVCIYSRFKGTVQYIETALQEHHPRIVALTGDMTEDERRKALDVFRENRGVLVTSLVAVQGLTFTAGAVVFYDSDWGEEFMAVALARISAPETTTLDVVYLREENAVPLEG